MPTLHTFTPDGTEKIFNPRTTEQRFWSRVAKTEGCWNYTGHLTTRGYGVFQIEKSPVSAHRFSYFLAYGPFADRLHVLHRCDNRACVRPDHLFLGTHQENMADMVAKGRGRGRPGAEHNMAKLTSEQVLAMRQEYLAGATKAALARKYGISQTNSGSILSGEGWRTEESGYALVASAKRGIRRRRCENCNRLFPRGHDDPDGACWACARPSPETQLQRFYEEVARGR